MDRTEHLAWAKGRNQPVARINVPDGLMGTVANVLRSRSDG